MVARNPDVAAHQLQRLQNRATAAERAGQSPLDGVTRVDVKHRARRVVTKCPQYRRQLRKTGRRKRVAGEIRVQIAGVKHPDHALLRHGEYRAQQPEEHVADKSHKLLIFSSLSII